MTEIADAVVIGAGPAGLMAAETLADAGYSVIVVEGKPSAGRKLLMAGKSGLNLTKDEGFDAFLGQYDEAAEWLRPMLTGFSNEAVANWARDLGQAVFTGSSGRVFPKTMKSSPLLRAWLRRLDSKGVALRTRWKWTGLSETGLQFQTPDGPLTLQPKATVLALGGASWSRLGSDGAWVGILASKGVEIAPLQPANVGFTVNWSNHMTRHFGHPVKACRLIAGTTSVRGEFVISAKGLEGGGIYAVSKRLRLGDTLKLDLLPDWSEADIQARLARPRGKSSLSNHLRKTLRLDPARLALLQEFAHPLPNDPALLAALLKSLPVRHQGPRPLDEAISTAGGVTQTALNDSLMLKAAPGVFCAGEMLDWEAPTGGYLLTACFATGRWAGLGAATYLSEL